MLFAQIAIDLVNAVRRFIREVLLHRKFKFTAEGNATLKGDCKNVGGPAKPGEPILA
jgi:hypothetical protein